MANPPALAPVYRVDELRRIESAAAGIPMMERAGAAAAEIARTMASERGGPVLVLAGPGNNGGDAFIVARVLRESFFDVVVLFRGDVAKLPRDAAAARRAFAAGGGATVSAWPERFNGSLIVDGLFGIGLARPLAAADAALVERANATGIPILALDIPSGVNADTGVPMGPAIRARATATFIALKPGLLTADAVDLCGDISVHSLGLDPEATTPAPGHRLDWDSLAAALPAVLERRTRNVHKGTFGTLGIVGGAEGMIGAPCSRAAPRFTQAPAVLIGFADPPGDRLGTAGLMLRRIRADNATPDVLVCGRSRRNRRPRPSSRKRSQARCRSCSTPMRSTDRRRFGDVRRSRCAHGAHARYAASGRGGTVARHERCGCAEGSSRCRSSARREAQCRGRRQRCGQRARVPGWRMGHQRDR
jgi:hydroxyethylthiazole kinase-like uncharacterized protein yjeF